MERISLDKNSGTSMIPVVFPQKKRQKIYFSRRFRSWKGSSSGPTSCALAAE